MQGEIDYPDVEDPETGEYIPFDEYYIKALSTRADPYAPDGLDLVSFEDHVFEFLPRECWPIELHELNLIRQMERQQIREELGLDDREADPA